MNIQLDSTTLQIAKQFSITNDMPYYYQPAEMRFFKTKVLYSVFDHNTKEIVGIVHINKAPNGTRPIQMMTVGGTIHNLMTLETGKRVNKKHVFNAVIDTLSE